PRSHGIRFLVALAVLLGADIARGGQIGEHLIEVLRGLPFEARRLGFSSRAPRSRWRRARSRRRCARRASARSAPRASCRADRPAQTPRRRGKRWLPTALASVVPNRECDAATCRHRGARSERWW